VLTDEAHNLAGGALWSSERESQDSTAKRLVLFLQVHHTWAPTPFTCNFWSWSLVLQTCMDPAHLAQSHTQAINQSHPELPHPKRFFMSLLLQADRAPAACFAPTNHKIPCHDTTPAATVGGHGMADFKVPRQRRELLSICHPTTATPISQQE